MKKSKNKKISKKFQDDFLKDAQMILDYVAKFEKKYKDILPEETKNDLDSKK